MVKEFFQFSYSDYFINPDYLEKTGLKPESITGLLSMAAGVQMTPIMSLAEPACFDIGDHDLSFVIGTPQLDEIMSAVAYLERQTGYRPKLGLSQIHWVRPDGSIV